MKTCNALLLSLFLSFIATSVSAQSNSAVALPSISLPADLDRVLRDYESAWAAGDAEALALLFTEDGFVMSGGSQPTRGRSAIENRYANAGGPLMLRAFAYEANADLAYIFGAYTYEEGTDQGKFVLTLRKSGGKWLITSDQDNPIND